MKSVIVLDGQNMEILNVEEVFRDALHVHFFGRMR